MKQTEVSRATVGRIPSYLKHLKSLNAATVNISATALAKALGLGEVQVRKDLSAVSGAGRPKTGYNVQALITALEHFLGTNSHSSVVIVGAGKLGRALLDYGGFNEYGLNLLAAFDTAVLKTEFSHTGKPIYSMSKLDAFCSANAVRIGVIAVPAESAQQVCNRLVQNSIQAIWCFAPCTLKVPENIPVQYENMALSLAYLNTKINDQRGK